MEAERTLAGPLRAGALAAQETARGPGAVAARSAAASAASCPGVRALLLLLAVLLAGAAAAVPAHARQVDPDEPVNLNFQDLDLAYVLSAMAQAAGINLIYHDLPAKPVTLRTAQPIPRSDIPLLIRTLAAANGVAVFEEVGFLRLVGGAVDLDPRQLYIYRLRHARAANLSATLQSLFGGGAVPTGRVGLPATLSQQLQQLQQQAGAAPAQAPQTFVIGAGAAGLEGNVLIVPEEVTNSLLIRATPADWSVVQQALQALDLRPLQVVIEVVIAEVSHSDGLDLGVSFRGVRETAGGFGVLDLPAFVPDDAFLVEVARFGNVDVHAALAALATTGDVRILSRPVVLAQNNQPARILVGSQQPFVQVSQTDFAGNPIQTVQYRDVGTVLNILPTINEDGYVNLAVAQEVSSATAETQFGAPVISTREAETQVLARNGQTVVLGGLVDHQVDRVHTGIPFLKDIPILGLLFGSVRERRGDSELFLFLTPYIVASDEDADLLRQRIEEQRGLVQPLLPGETLTPPVTLPGPPVPPIPPPDTLPPPPPPDTLLPPPPDTFLASPPDTLLVWTSGALLASNADTHLASTSGALRAATADGSAAPDGPAAPAPDAAPAPASDPAAVRPRGGGGWSR